MSYFNDQTPSPLIFSWYYATGLLLVSASLVSVGLKTPHPPLPPFSFDIMVLDRTGCQYLHKVVSFWTFLLLLFIFSQYSRVLLFCLPVLAFHLKGINIYMSIHMIPSLFYFCEDLVFCYRIMYHELFFITWVCAFLFPHISGAYFFLLFPLRNTSPSFFFFFIFTWNSIFSRLYLSYIFVSHLSFFFFPPLHLYFSQHYPPCFYNNAHVACTSHFFNHFRI